MRKLSNYNGVLVYKKPVASPPIVVRVEVVEEKPESVAGQDAHHIIQVALGDRYDLLKGGGISDEEALFDLKNNRGEKLLGVKGIGPATIQKAQERINE